jgi:uncharacterized repeat protein (TIGR03806 family)
VKLAGIARSLILASAALAALAVPARAVSDPAILGPTPPRQLSEFGFFEDPREQAPASGVVPFRLATPLFSDGAEKFRFVYVPNGQAAAYNAVEAFDFPVGTALVKTFAFPADYRKPAEKLRLIETRVLLHHADGWSAWAYLWNDQQTDATLKIAGAKVSISSIGTDGAPLSFDYSVPNKNQCKACHAFNGKITPLGPKARNLNIDYAYARGTENQLVHWRTAGLLTGVPEAAEIPAAADWRDETTTLEKRARTWLDVNCAHCHRAEGPASNTGLFLTYGENVPVRYGVLKRPAAAGRGSGDREFDIVPGEPDRSIVTYRVESTVPGVMMPELGRHIADPDAVKLLADWIASLR